MEQDIKQEFQNIKVGFQDLKQDIDDLTEITRKSFDSVEKRMVTKEDFDDLFEVVNKTFEIVEAKMATKEDLGRLKLDLIDAMAEKNAELRGDLVVLMRKEDFKLISLVELLKKKMVLTENEAKTILTMEPFPRLIM